MKKMTPTLLILLFWLCSTVLAEYDSSAIIISAGELDSITEYEIVIKICTGRAANGETTCPSKIEIFTLNEATRCFDADESSMRKLHEEDAFWVYDKISHIECSALSDRDNVSVYHIENTTDAVAVRDNAVPMKLGGGLIVMPMTGNFTPYDYDPVLHQL